LYTLLQQQQAQNPFVPVPTNKHPSGWNSTQQQQHHQQQAQQQCGQTLAAHWLDNLRNTIQFTQQEYKAKQHQYYLDQINAQSGFQDGITEQQPQQQLLPQPQQPQVGDLDQKDQIKAVDGGGIGGVDKGIFVSSDDKIEPILQTQPQQPLVVQQATKRQPIEHTTQHDNVAVTTTTLSTSASEGTTATVTGSIATGASSLLQDGQKGAVLLTQRISKILKNNNIPTNVLSVHDVIHLLNEFSPELQQQLVFTDKTLEKYVLLLFQHQNSVGSSTTSPATTTPPQTNTAMTVTPSGSSSSSNAGGKFDMKGKRGEEKEEKEEKKENTMGSTPSSSSAAAEVITMTNTTPPTSNDTYGDKITPEKMGELDGRNRRRSSDVDKTYTSQAQQANKTSAPGDDRMDHTIDVKTDFVQKSDKKDAQHGQHGDKHKNNDIDQSNSTENGQMDRKTQSNAAAPSKSSAPEPLNPSLPPNQLLLYRQLSLLSPNDLLQHYNRLHTQYLDGYSKFSVFYEDMQKRQHSANPPNQAQNQELLKMHEKLQQLAEILHVLQIIQQERNEYGGKDVG
jgi:hypothetical protein